MTLGREPTRLADLPGDEPEGLRRALVAARRAGPDGAGRGRIAAGIAAALDGSGDHAPPRAVASPWRLPIAITAGLATVAMVATLSLRPRPPQAPPAAALPATAPAATTPAQATPARTAPAAPEPGPAAAPETAQAATAAPAGNVEAARLPVRTALPPHHTSIKSASVGRRAPVVSEADLLRRAQEALRDQPGHALALVGEHATLYPTGALSQERDVIGVEALMRLGRAEEARQAARRFLDQHPDSPHRTHVEALLSR
jgi:hypothetical protein